MFGMKKGARRCNALWMGSCIVFFLTNQMVVLFWATIVPPTTVLHNKNRNDDAPLEYAHGSTKDTSIPDKVLNNDTVTVSETANPDATRTEENEILQRQNLEYEASQLVLNDMKSTFVPLLGKNVTKPVRVILYPYFLKGQLDGQTFHLGQDGIYQSPFLRLASNAFDFNDTTTVWLADESTSKTFRHFCVEFTTTALQPVWNDDVKGFYRTGRNDDFPPIHVLSAYHDYPNPNRCGILESFLSNNNNNNNSQPRVLYWKRSVVYERHWDSDVQWVKPGRIELPDHQRHVNIPVRTDVVQQVADYLFSKLQLPLWHAIEQLPRPIDVAHFWPVNRNDYSVLPDEGNLRYRVSEALVEWRNEQEQKNIQTNGSSFVVPNLLTSVRGRARWQGRASVFEEYIETCLSTKIHVVAQRDAFEDHFRLLEALVTGALVMTDPMLTLPAGLVNGTNIIVYYSAAELKHYVQYYLNPAAEPERLRIAHAGRFVAMSRHRSWHRMEEIIYGRVLTTCQSVPTLHCPYTVHAVTPPPTAGGGEANAKNTTSTTGIIDQFTTRWLSRLHAPFGFMFQWYRQWS